LSRRGHKQAKWRQLKTIDAIFYTIFLFLLVKKQGSPAALATIAVKSLCAGVRQKRLERIAGRAAKNTFKKRFKLQTQHLDPGMIHNESSNVHYSSTTR
jgi:hypothetical protein